MASEKVRNGVGPSPVHVQHLENESQERDCDILESLPIRLYIHLLFLRSSTEIPESAGRGESDGNTC